MEILKVAKSKINFRWITHQPNKKKERERETIKLLEENVQVKNNNPSVLKHDMTPLMI